MAGPDCKATVSWTVPVVSDCGVVSVNSTHSPGDIFPIGSTQVVYTAVDDDGNIATCSFDVVVEDESKPVFQNCPADIYLELDTVCEAVVTWTEPTAEDNCDITSVSRTHIPGSVFPLGTTIVAYTAKDSFGNEATCNFKVILTFNGAPVISNCPGDIEVVAGENDQAIVTWHPPNAVTACGDISLTSSHTPSSVFPIGITTVEYKAEGALGSVSYCTFNVTVIRDVIDIDVSKVITPDGNGHNDEWTVGNVEKYQNNKVVVVDRWGSVIYMGTGYNNTNVVWNGTNRNGEPVPTGTYFYTITVRYGSEAIEKSGFIELIR
jgi:gliding motility-associated-like protein